MVSVKNLIVKAGNHSALHPGFLRLSRVLPTPQVFISGYVNTETILHFFIMWCHKMNMSASFLVWIALKPAFFTIEYFNFQVYFPCKWELFFEIKKETSCEIDKVRK